MSDSRITQDQILEAARISGINVSGADAYALADNLTAIVVRDSCKIAQPSSIMESPTPAIRVLPADVRGALVQVYGRGADFSRAAELAEVLSLAARNRFRIDCSNKGQNTVQPCKVSDGITPAACSHPPTQAAKERT